MGASCRAAAEANADVASKERSPEGRTCETGVKPYVLVEGATHVFTPCRPECGDTIKRLFDYVDKWLSDPNRFPLQHKE